MARIEEEALMENKRRNEVRKRTIYDLQQKYESYKFQIFRFNKTPHERRRILIAMQIIAKQLREMGASYPGQSPREIGATLKKSGKI